MNMIDKPKKAPAETPDPNEHPKREEALDEAVADSMIASDPPASVSMGQPTAPPRRPKSADETDKQNKSDAAHLHLSGKTDHR
jgi:hypothetical protein